MSRRAKPGASGAAPAAFALSGLALAGLTALVLLTDPGLREQELFVGILLVATGGLAAGVLLAFGKATTLGATLRALRRGLLFGLGCAGAVVLQLNGALNLPNLAFLALVLLIAEMVFLARRQNPA